MLIGNYLSIKASMNTEGLIDCSTSPNYPTSTGGSHYYISASGKIGGASGIDVVTGNYILCKTATSPTGNQATVGTNWDVMQGLVDFSNVYVSGGVLNDVRLGSLVDDGIVSTSSANGTLMVDTTSYLTISSASASFLKLDCSNDPLTGSLTIGDGTDEEIDWASGNVTYVPIGGDIETYVTNATAGDTLVLASGTYTITTDIDIAKSINIVGQGRGKTIIHSNTAMLGMFDVKASNVRISDLTITFTTTNATYGVVFDGTGGTVLTGCDLENVDITSSSSGGTAIGVWWTDAGGEYRNGSINMAVTSYHNITGIDTMTNSTAEANQTVRLYNLNVTTSGVGGLTCAVINYDNSSTKVSTLIASYCRFQALVPGGYTYALYSIGDGTTSYMEYCVLDGANGDSYASASAVILRATDLIHGTRIGLTYYTDGELNTSDLYVADDITITGDFVANGAVNKFGALTTNGFLKTSSSTGALFVDSTNYLPYSVTAMSDGTYTMGSGITVNGTITITSGVITALTQAA